MTSTGTPLGKVGHETVLCRRRHIAHVGPATFIVDATAAYHHVRVDIDRIDGVGHTDEVVPVQQFLEVARVRLGTVVDEYLVDVEVDATGQEVVLQDGLAQEVVALLRTVATESLGGGHLVDSLVHGLDDGRTQRLCHIADAQGNDISLGMHHLEGIHLLSNVGKQIVVL